MKVKNQTKALGEFADLSAAPFHPWCQPARVGRPVLGQMQAIFPGLSALWAFFGLFLRLVLLQEVLEGSGREAERQHHAKNCGRLQWTLERPFGG